MIHKKAVKLYIYGVLLSESKTFDKYPRKYIFNVKHY